VPNVKQRLGIGTPLGEASPAEIVSLLIGGAVIELDNGWQLTSARMAGDEVVELVLNGVPRYRVPALGAAANKDNYHRLGQPVGSVSYCLKAGYVPWGDRDVQPTRLAVSAWIQEQFAAKVGVTFSTVNRWENGRGTSSPLAMRRIKELLEQLHTRE